MAHVYHARAADYHALVHGDVFAADGRAPRLQNQTMTSL